MTLATRLAHRLAADGEFGLASRYWTGRLCFDLGGEVIVVALIEGAAAVGLADGPAARGDLRISAAREVWDKILQPVPPPYFHDIVPAQGFGLRVEGEPETFWQYYPAVRRAVDVLRNMTNEMANEMANEETP